MYKKPILFIVLTLLLFAITACAETQTYQNEIIGFSCVIPEQSVIEEMENQALINVDDTLSIVISSQSVEDMADPFYLTLYQSDELGMLSGAFESNYHNQVYVSQLFEYLFSDSDRDYTVFAFNETTFASYPAWGAEFVSADNYTFGHVYLCVEHAKRYIIIFYINDTYENRHRYDESINDFMDGFTINTTNEVD